MTAFTMPNMVVELGMLEKTVIFWNQIYTDHE